MISPGIVVFNFVGMPIGTAIPEGMANFLVNRRMNKSQQM
jgi:hypothetical protein